MTPADVTPERIQAAAERLGVLLGYGTWYSPVCGDAREQAEACPMMVLALDCGLALNMPDLEEADAEHVASQTGLPYPWVVGFGQGWDQMDEEEDHERPGWTAEDWRLYEAGYRAGRDCDEAVCGRLMGQQQVKAP